jgi:hypothetical protein
MGAVLDRVLVWVLFTVLAGLVPIGVDALIRDPPVTFASLLGQGQLLLITIATTSAALGSLVSSRAPQRAKVVVTGFCATGLVLLGVFYGKAATHRGIGDHSVVKWSLIIFCGAGIFGAVAVGLAREARQVART